MEKINVGEVYRSLEYIVVLKKCVELYVKSIENDEEFKMRVIEWMDCGERLVEDLEEKFK